MQLKQAMEIGKNGINEGVIAEIKRQLEKHKVMKIRIQKSYWPEFDLEDFLKKTNSKLAQKVGHTITIKKR